MSDGSGNRIHPTAVLEGDVQLGRNNVVGPMCLVRGPVVIGDDNHFTSHVCIGTPGQETREVRYDDSESLVVIGDRNTIREFTAVQKPYHEARTRLGNDNFLMQSVHVPHDCDIADGVVITPMVALAGLTRIQSRANLALHSSVNQFIVVGGYSIVASGHNVRQHVRPFTRTIPGRPESVNVYALRKFDLLEHTQEIEAYVHDGAQPSTPALADVVLDFERACQDRDAARQRI